jgi:hypothetical protein
MGGIWVYIRFLGYGCLGFRPDGGSLLKSPEAGPVKSNQNASAPPLGASLGLGIPSLRHCSVGRREGPSMAQRGYPGIHAGMPTPQCLRSAIVVNGAPGSTSIARRPSSQPGSWWDRVSPVGASLLATAVSQSMKLLNVPASSRAGLRQSSSSLCNAPSKSCPP